MGGVLSAVIYGLPLEQVNSPFIINSGLRQSINPPWQFAYLLGQPVPPLQQMAGGGCDSTVWPRKVLARFANMQRGGEKNVKVNSESWRSGCLGCTEKYLKVPPKLSFKLSGPQKMLPAL